MVIGEEYVSGKSKRAMLIIQERLLGDSQEIDSIECKVEFLSFEVEIGLLSYLLACEILGFNLKR